MMKEKESDIVKAITDYLTAKRHFFWRNNTGATKTIGGGFIRFGAVGSPDICVIHEGFFIGLEVKKKGEKQSTDQVEWERKCREAGAEYHVVRSIDDVQNIGL